MRAPDALREQRGMTLIELMVSLTFSSIIIMLAMKTQGPQRRAIIDLRDRAYAAAELKLATEWLRHDLAAGDQVSLRGPFFHIEREGELSSQYGAWTGSWDLGIGYRLDGKNLLRIDWKTAEAHMVATGLTAFDISNTGNAWTIHIAIGTGFAGRTLDLIWKN